MKTQITTSKTKAIQLAKNFLRTGNNVKRLGYTTVKSTSCQCNCGETIAYTVLAEIKGEYKDYTVGVCSCANN